MKCRRRKDSRGARLRRQASEPPPARVNDQPLGQRASAPSSMAAAELRIDGPAQGSISYAGTVIVGHLGAVEGGITATVIVVEGQVNGDLQAAQAVRLAATARVIGDLTAPRVAVARGASLRGRISTQRHARNTGGELDEATVAEMLIGS
jgi:cytoskeletal protein CcmA (bactofilin family)